MSEKTSSREKSFFSHKKVIIMLLKYPSSDHTGKLLLTFTFKQEQAINQRSQVKQFTDKLKAVIS